jgi:hypothetical protein
VDEVTRDRMQKLIYLQWHWDTAYDITQDGGNWQAERLDGRGVLTAESPEDLREKIHDDYRFCPVARPVKWRT